MARASVSEAEAQELLTRVGLGEWIAQLPHGVHTSLGSQAATVSGGERRRLLLALSAGRARRIPTDRRARRNTSIPKPPILLIRDLLRSGHHQDPAKARTVVLVTHRLAPLRCSRPNHHALQGICYCGNARGAGRVGSRVSVVNSSGRKRLWLTSPE